MDGERWRSCRPLRTRSGERDRFRSIAGDILCSMSALPVRTPRVSGELRKVQDSGVSTGGQLPLDHVDLHAREPEARGGARFSASSNAARLNPHLAARRTKGTELSPLLIIYACSSPRSCRSQGRCHSVSCGLWASRYFAAERQSPQLCTRVAPTVVIECFSWIEARLLEAKGLPSTVCTSMYSTHGPSGDSRT